MTDEKMKRMQKLLESCPKDAFACVKLSFQNWVEVCPRFQSSHIGELKDEWIVISPSGKYHKLKYNGLNGFPMITEGWEQLKKFEGFPDSVSVILAYYGSGMFSIVAFDEITSFEEIPGFHSRTMLALETVWFDVVLSQYDIYKKKLGIKDEFAEYVKKKSLEEISILTDDGVNYGMVVKSYLNSNCAKLGYNWFWICECNNFVGGDVVRFKFSSGDRCHVFKIGHISD